MLGFDAGADGDRTMMLVYDMPRTEAIFERFGGVDGSAYLVGGFGDIVVVPIASGSASVPISAISSSRRAPPGIPSDPSVS